MRTLRGWQRVVVGGWLLAAPVFHLYTAATGILQPRLQRGAHLLFLLPMAFLLYPATKKSPKDRFTVVDVILAVLAMFPPLYLMINNDALNMRFEFIEPLTTVQIVLGVLNILLLLEAIRRAVAPAMAVLVSILIGYVYLAPYLPGIFYNRPLKFSRTIEMYYLITDSGIYGSITGISATVVALFVIFGAILEITKIGDYLTKVASKVVGKSPGGPAKVAVLGSGLFGMISGVAASNVFTTGSFTIPMMKRLGYKPEFAGAVEAVASTGGIFMPPVMGAAAFVMAELTKTPYIKICVAAALGAVFYYVTLILTVHFTALKNGLRGLAEEEIPTWKEVVANSYLLLPAVVLVYLLIKGFSPFMAAYYAVWVAFGISFLRKDTMMTPERLFVTLEKAGKNMIVVALACAGAGIVVSVFTYTGLGLGIASVISSLAAGKLLIALVLVMFTCLILGMGMPTTPAYIIAATIGGMVLTKMGLDILTAHLFAFYFAILSEVTPPVCVASYCAASIAGTSPMKVGFEGMKLALTGYIVPYVFVYNKAMMLRGSLWEIIITVVLMALLSFLLSAAVAGYFGKPTNLLVRSMLLVSASLLVGVLTVSSSIRTIVAVVGLLSLLVYGFIHLRGKKNAESGL